MLDRWGSDGFICLGMLPGHGREREAILALKALCNYKEKMIANTTTVNRENRKERAFLYKLSGN